MKLSSRKIEREKRIELSMTSMIDVVFLLLIFFMTTASFVKTERQLDSAIRVKNKTAEQALLLMEDLEDQEDVQNVYSNFDIDEEIMEQMGD